MDYKKLNEIASKLEERHISESAKGIHESKDILAIIQAYRILSLNTESGSDNRSLQYPLQVIRNVDKSKIKVNRYILDNDNVEHIWSNDWYGHHIIGNDCEFNEL